MDDIAHDMDDGGMKIVMEAFHPRVASVHERQKLGEIIGSDGERINPPGQLGDDIDGRRYFDHNSDVRFCGDVTFGREIRISAVPQAKGRVDLIDPADHGEKDLQVVEPGIGTQQCPRLGQKDFGVIKSEAYAAPAQKRVGFSDGEKRKFLITTGV